MPKIVEDFKQRMLIVDRSGIHRDFAGTKLVEIRESVFYVEGRQILYERILECRADKSILHLTLVDAENHRAEHHLKYNGFIPFGAARKTEELASRIRVLMTLAGANKIDAKAVENAQWLKRNDDKHYVKVFSYSTRFPQKCPICLSPATHLATMQKSSTHFLIAELETYTLKTKVPVCANHTSLKAGISISDMSPSTSQITYAFDNEQYAREFFDLNAST